MLRLYSPQTGQLLRDSREVQKAVESTVDLAPQDAIREVTETLEAISPLLDSDPPAMLHLLAILDEASHAHTRVLCEGYLEENPQPGHHDLFLLAHHFWAQLANCFSDLLAAFAAAGPIPDDARAELCVRLIRASTEGQRWDALHYGPFEPRHWARIGQAWLAAVGVEQRPVRLRPERQTETSVEREYMRAVAFFICAPEALDEIQIEQAWRLIHYMLPALELRRTPSDATLYCIDPEAGRPPVRVSRITTESLMRRHFSAPHAIETFTELERAQHAGELPPILDVPAPEAAIRFTAMLNHLKQYWSPEPPVRGHRRHPMPAQLQVVDGIENVIDCLAGGVGLVSSTWEQLDVSLHGIGAQATLSEKHPLRVGRMIALHSDDSEHWLIGVVRRVMRVAEERAFIGTEFLSWHAAVVRADDGVQEVRALLLDVLHKAATVRVALPTGTARSEAPLFLLDQGKAVKLNPVELLEHTGDYEIRSYQVAAAHRPELAA
jgi:hypothetical protein